MVEEEVEEFTLFFLQHADLACECHFDCAFAADLQDIGIGFKLIPACIPAGERSALKTQMLVQDGT